MALTSSGPVGRWIIVLVGWTLLFHSAALAENSLSSEANPPSENISTEAERSFFKRFFGNLESEFQLSAGLRTDALDWSIAGTRSGGTPNVLSELSWSDVDSYQVSLVNRSHYKKHVYFRGNFNYAWIQDGSVRDSDYTGDFRSGEWSRSISETNDDEAWDLSLGGGYSFFFMQDRLSISPLAGFSYHKQNLRITNGRQVIAEDNPFSADPGDNPPAIGPLSSQLNSTYFARWMGPWVGCDIRYRLQDRSPRFPPIQLGLSVEIHWADYYGEGNWNLRSDLAHPKSFEHEADGNGINITGECLIQLAAHWDLSLNLTVQEWSTSRGKDRKFLADGGTARTRLNKVNWESTSFMVGAVYRF